MESNDRILAGAPNFRDIGGCATRDGRRVKRGRVFRSGELSQLTGADFDTLRRLGIAYLVDLRSSRECELHRSSWPSDMGTEIHLANVSMDVRIDGRPIMELIKADPSPAAVGRLVEQGFAVIADFCGPALATITHRLAACDAPVLFHCTNGRDRTGVIAAMLLYMLGVPRAAIVQDFLLTNTRIDFETVVVNSIAAFRKALDTHVDRELVAMVSLVRPEYIDTMFDAFDANYGSPEGYLRRHGIDAALQARLRGQLLEPA